VAESFSERVARLAAARAAAQPESTPEPEHPEDVIPVIDLGSGYERSEVDEEIDRIVDGIDILEAYDVWCGKMKPKVGNRTESIMISCPKPDHRDRTPSAWINTEKQTWFCGTCNEGGDKLDIAAYHFGFPVPGYKEGKDFPTLLRKIAEDKGYYVEKTPGGAAYLKQAEIEHEPDDAAIPVGVTDRDDAPAAAGSGDPTPLADRMGDLRSRLSIVPDAEPEAAAAEPALTVVSSIAPEPTPAAEPVYPSIDWRKILPGDSFMRRWMEVTTVNDDLPDEYYFWNGMLAVGMAAGRTTTLADHPPVHANLFVCLFGRSGDGKSRSIGPLLDLMRRALPYDHDDEYSTGTYLVPTPGSAEALVDSFSKPVPDPADPKRIAFHAPVRGLVRMDELSTITGRASRAGSVMKPTMMELFDCYNRVELKSRGAGHTIAEDPFASMLTTTQPKAIRDLVSQTDADSGFLNRWIFASGPPRDRQAFGRTPINVSRCVDPLRDIRTWAADHPVIGLTPEAMDVWTGFFGDTIAQKLKDSEDGLLVRTDLHMKKMMLLFALDRREEMITASTMMDVIALWDYLVRSYAALGGNIGLGPLEDARLAILEIIEQFASANSGKGISRRDLGRWAARRRIPVEDLAKVLPIMVMLDQIEEAKVKPTRGPVRIVYKVVE
jgi:hypothetical protein